MANDNRMQSGILGDINPTDAAKNDRSACRPSEGAGSDEIEAMEGGSKHDRSEHSGSRDVTEGVTGGPGTETGGTRHYPAGPRPTGRGIGERAGWGGGGWGMGGGGGGG